MRSVYRYGQLALFAALILSVWAIAALAQTPAPRRRGSGAAPAAAPKIDTGDTAWMLTSTALVLMMTIPGLALFYGGMVRKKNVLATVMQCFAITCLVTVLWWSSATASPSPTGSAVSSAALSRLHAARHGRSTRSTISATTIPESVFMMFQMIFAIITPALISGAFAERMKFSALLLVHRAVVASWSTARSRTGSGAPTAGSASAGVLDFAGGTVVHINAGVAGLVGALVLGKRRGYGQRARWRRTTWC